MKSFIKENNKGVTLVALVITIIVLLILAGVSLSMVLRQDGIFGRAEQATDKYGQSKARETLELVLGEAQMQKYEEGLNEEQLDNKINEIGELLPKENPNSNNQQVIVDGSIFEIDRSVPKIVYYVGKADGVIITARITQNGDWQNPVATVVIGNADVSRFPTNGGNYTIENITEDTDIKITAEDNKDKSNEKVIKVRPRIDTTPPTLSNAKVEVDKMKIKISIIATDSESGLAQINYKITPNTLDSTTPAEDTLESGEEKEIITKKEGEYTITFTAIDNAGNTTNPGVTAKATTIDGITVEEAKALIKDESSYKEYLGTKVIDYSPEAKGTWRVFYYDATGEFGDGLGTLYIRRDYDTTKTMKLGSDTPSENAIKIMKQMNPDWSTTNGKKDVSKFLASEKAVAGLCDTLNWTKYCDTRVAKYAIGAPSVEIWVKAQNTYRERWDTSASLIGCGIMNSTGYGYRVNDGDLVNKQDVTVVSDEKIEQAKVIISEASFPEWLASPSSYGTSFVCCVSSGACRNSTYSGTTFGRALPFRPVACIKH